MYSCCNEQAFIGDLRELSQSLRSRKAKFQTERHTTSICSSCAI